MRDNKSEESKYTEASLREKTKLEKQIKVDSLFRLLGIAIIVTSVYQTVDMPFESFSLSIDSLTYFAAIAVGMFGVVYTTNRVSAAKHELAILAKEISKLKSKGNQS